MPQHFLPRNSGPHRIACKALYRALLSKCDHIPVPEELYRGPINPIKYEIRKQFRRNVNDTSQRLVTAALKTGYEAESLLHDAATGSASALKTIHAHLEALKAAQAAARARPVNPPARHRPIHIKPAAHPSATRLLVRKHLPLSSLSGPRNVPTLVSANAVPFLRFKAPQSPFLTRIIRDVIRAREKRFDARDAIDAALEPAKAEDAWDKEVSQLLQQAARDDRRERSEAPPSVGAVAARGSRADVAADTNVDDGNVPVEQYYTATLQYARVAVFAAIRKSQQKELSFAKRMLAFAETERELAVKERAERKAARRRRRGPLYRWVGARG